MTAVMRSVPRILVIAVFGLLTAACCGRRTRPAPVVDADTVAAPEEPEPVPSSTGEAFKDCEEDNKQIYVVTEQYQLFRYLPIKRTFHPLGKLRCNLGTAQPFSMAVDRRGLAYVLYNDGTLYKLSTRTMECEETKFDTDLPDMKLFGMAFATDGVDSTSESLWVAGSKSPFRVARINVATMRLETPVGLSGKGGSFELTGRGDGRLFGFDPAPPARLVEINRRTGLIEKDAPITGLPPTCNNWAVAQYWGDFWIFCGTQLTRFALKDRTSELVEADLGFRVVGAGVSTCAPSARP